MYIHDKQIKGFVLQKYHALLPESPSYQIVSCLSFSLFRYPFMSYKEDLLSRRNASFFRGYLIIGILSAKLISMSQSPRLISY